MGGKNFGWLAVWVPSPDWLCRMRRYQVLRWSRRTWGGGVAGRAPTGCQVTSRPRNRLLRYSKWLVAFRTAFVSAEGCLWFITVFHVCVVFAHRFFIATSWWDFTMICLVWYIGCAVIVVCWLLTGYFNSECVVEVNEGWSSGVSEQLCTCHTAREK